MMTRLESLYTTVTTRFVIIFVYLYVQSCTVTGPRRNGNPRGRDHIFPRHPPFSAKQL